MAGYEHGKTLKTPRGIADHTHYQIRRLKDVEQRLLDRIDHLKRVEAVHRGNVKSLSRAKQIKKPLTPEELIREGNKLLAKIQAERPQPPGIGAQRMAEFIEEEDIHAKLVGRGYGKPVRPRTRPLKASGGASYDIAA